MGLRAEHIQEMVPDDDTGTLLVALKRFVVHCANGRAPLSLQPYFAGANLTALEKKGNDVRPLAAGEVLRRIVSKVLCYMEFSHAAKYFFPLQMGVAQKAGTERIVHSARRHFNRLKEGSDMFIMKIDLSNAFNRVSRRAMLTLVRKYFPRLTKWIEWCYTQNSILSYANWEILSCEGVQQGDPLGPLLFSLVLHEIIKKINITCPDLLLNKWYLDDGVIMGKSSDLLKVLNLLETEGPKYGHHINLKKFEIIYKTERGAESSSYHEYSYHYRVRDIFPHPIRLIHANENLGFEILGAPIGPKGFCENYVRTSVFTDLEKGIACCIEN